MVYLAAHNSTWFEWCSFLKEEKTKNELYQKMPFILQQLIDRQLVDQGVYYITDQLLNSLLLRQVNLLVTSRSCTAEKEPQGYSVMCSL